MYCLIKHQDTKIYWGSLGNLHAFLNLALNESEWSSSRFDRFTPEANSPLYLLDTRLGGLHTKVSTKYLDLRSTKWPIWDIT